MKKYNTYFSVLYDDGKQEDYACKSVKQAITMLKEIDLEKSKCRAKVTIIKRG